MATELTIARGTNGQFLKGSKGLGGRKPGSRNKLGEKFISDTAADWQKNGKAALETVRNEHPEIYLRVIASIIPRDIWQRIEVTGEINLKAEVESFVQSFEQCQRMIGADVEDAEVLP